MSTPPTPKRVGTTLVQKSHRAIPTLPSSFGNTSKEALLPLEEATNFQIPAGIRQCDLIRSPGSMGVHRRLRQNHLSFRRRVRNDTAKDFRMMLSASPPWEVCAKERVR